MAILNNSRKMVHLLPSVSRSHSISRVRSALSASHMVSHSGLILVNHPQVFLLLTNRLSGFPVAPVVLGRHWLRIRIAHSLWLWALGLSSALSVQDTVSHLRKRSASSPT